MLDVHLSILVCQNNHSVGHAPLVAELVPVHKIGFELDMVKSAATPHVGRNRPISADKSKQVRISEYPSPSLKTVVILLDIYENTRQANRS